MALRQRLRKRGHMFCRLCVVQSAFLLVSKGNPLSWPCRMMLGRVLWWACGGRWRVGRWGGGWGRGEFFILFQLREHKQEMTQK